MTSLAERMWEGQSPPEVLWEGQSPLAKKRKSALSRLACRLENDDGPRERLPSLPLPSSLTSSPNVHVDLDLSEFGRDLEADDWSDSFAILATQVLDVVTSPSTSTPIAVRGRTAPPPLFRSPLGLNEEPALSANNVDEYDDSWLEPGMLEELDQVEQAAVGVLQTVSSACCDEVVAGIQPSPVIGRDCRHTAAVPLVPPHPAVTLVPPHPAVPLVPPHPAVPLVPPHPAVTLVPPHPAVPLVPPRPAVTPLSNSLTNLPPRRFYPPKARIHLHTRRSSAPVRKVPCNAVVRRPL